MRVNDRVNHADRCLWHLIDDLARGCPLQPFVIRFGFLESHLVLVDREPRIRCKGLLAVQDESAR